MKFHTLVSLATVLLILPNTAFSKDRSCNSREPVNTINEMFDTLYACWQPPAGTSGMSITLRFSLRHDGSIIAKPRTTYTKKIANDAISQAFVASILEALNKSLPLPLTESMGGAIAGRPLALLFTAGERQHDL